jgi:sugar (pentulose or hexulose) kinase
MSVALSRFLGDTTKEAKKRARNARRELAKLFGAKVGPVIVPGEDGVLREVPRDALPPGHPLVALGTCTVDVQAEILRWEERLAYNGVAYAPRRSCVHVCPEGDRRRRGYLPDGE